MYVNVLIIKNSRYEGPGLIGELLEERGWESYTVDLDCGETIPDPLAYSCVFVLGGPDSANDTSEKMKSEILWIRRILTLGIPYFGICLGMQTLVKASGGRVVSCPEREIGWRNSEGEFYHLTLTREGRTDALCSGIPEQIPVFQLHGEMVIPSSHGKVLATGQPCNVQMVKEGYCAYGIQGHPELTEELLRIWLKTDADLNGMNREMILEEYNQLKAEYLENGRRILENFLDKSSINTK